MPILLCASTKEEIAPTLEFIQRKELNDKIDVLITGVGLTAATYNLTKAAIKKRPDFMMQAGIAGSLNDQLLIGETFVVESETFGDMGVVQDNVFTTLFNLHLLNENDFPFKDCKLINRDINRFKSNELKLVSGVTVNEITTSHERIRYYKDDVGASIETMEGAALHFVALMENITFLQLRSVSNYVGERDKTKWDLSGAINNLNKQLQDLISQHLNHEV
jgi:futalosine hydrolase